MLNNDFEPTVFSLYHVHCFSCVNNLCFAQARVKQQQAQCTHDFITPLPLETKQQNISTDDMLFFCPGQSLFFIIIIIIIIIIIKSLAFLILGQDIGHQQTQSILFNLGPVS